MELKSCDKVTLLNKKRAEKTKLYFLFLSLSVFYIMESPSKRKGSVTFDLPPPQQEEELLSPCTHTIDIHAQSVPDTMLVALFDRDREMKELVEHNKSFFLSLKSFLNDKWPRFENTLYVPRSQMSDIEWITRISKALMPVPPLLEKFKELVGYLGEDDSQGRYEEEEEEEEGQPKVELARIRDRLGRLSQESYPQFYINCEQAMSKNEYDAFIHTLFHTAEIDDATWEKKIREQLKPWQNILEQLEEIVAYEIDE